MRAHVIKDGVVVNTIEVVDVDMTSGQIKAEYGGIGWLLIDGTLIPPMPVPVVRIREEVIADLEEIDRKSIRALREGDQVRIDGLEALAEVLRQELKNLE